MKRFIKVKWWSALLRSQYGKLRRSGEHLLLEDSFMDFPNNMRKTDEKLRASRARRISDSIMKGFAVHACVRV